MAKKAKTRRQRHRHSAQGYHQLSSSQILQEFKLLFADGQWVQALSSYRTWTSRAGRKRNPDIEAELLFRGASACYEDCKLGQAIQSLDEALRLDPERRNRYLFYQGICLAKSGDIEKSRSVFHTLKDEFHEKVLAVLADSAKTLPREAPEDVPFEKGMLLAFWDSITAGEEFESASRALRNIARANVLFARGEDPEPLLKPLERESGFESIACYLMLLFGVYKRRTIRVRNIMKFTHRALCAKDMREILDIHLVLLLREGDFNEIAALDRILGEYDIQMETLIGVRDEAFFGIGLREIHQNHPEKALDNFLKIENSTFPVIHNIALLYQQLERYGKANEYWIRLHQSEKKPKKADPEDAIISYASTLKHIAQNFLREDEPEKAHPYLEEAVRLAKDDIEALQSLQMVCLDLGRKREALRHARKLHEMEPDNEELLLGYIVTLRVMGDQDALIPLYKKALSRDLESEFLKGELFTCLVEKALRLRSELPEEARSLMEEAKQMEKIDPRLTYLEAFFLRMDGKVKQADLSFRKALTSTDDHMTGFQLGRAFYEDNLVGSAVELFREITLCDCPLSDDLFEDSIEFLAEHGDRDNAEQLCDLAVADKGYGFYSISEILLDYKKPAWALPYSLKLIGEEDADEDDRFLHLIILNKMGNGQKTLQFADTLYRAAMDREDSEDVDFFKYLIKQIKSKGRFKTRDD